MSHGHASNLMMANRPTINKRQLVARVARATRQPRSAVSVTVQALFDEMALALAGDQCVTIKDFGRLRPYRFAPEFYRHPKTGLGATLAPYRYVKFKAARALKQLARELDPEREGSPSASPAQATIPI